MARDSLDGLYTVIAMGSTPRKADLDAEGIPERLHSVVRRHARLIHAERSGGQLESARQVARDLCADLREALGDEWEAPLPEDPAALVEHIERT